MVLHTFFKKILLKPVSWLAHKYDSRPDEQRVFKALGELYASIQANPGKKGLVLPLDNNSKYLILSDQHKGAKDGSDDFSFAENNYLAALDYYYKNGFTFISLGDSEDLWENTIAEIKSCNKLNFEKEKFFLQNNRFIKIFGNHDLYWDNDPLAALNLESIYGKKVSIYEGLLLEEKNTGATRRIFLTHGHQGDIQSDGNWFAKWFVSTIWAPLQSYLRLNLNTPSNNDQLKTVHNRMMYDWSAVQNGLLLVTGHTHQPVFASLTHIESLYRRLDMARKTNETAVITELEKQIAKLAMKGATAPDFTAYKPMYFNTGCCCYDDGDITGIEIEHGYIRLMKWEYSSTGISERIVLDEALLDTLF